MKLAPRSVVHASLLPSSRVAMLGFGTSARIFAALLAPRGCALRAWDPALAGSGAAQMRADIEAAGVDAIDTLPEVLRGARLVVLDGVAMADELASLLQPGQRVLELAAAPAAEVDTVLAALGLPPGTHWQQACAAARQAMANSAPTTLMPAPRRGELP